MSLSLLTNEIKISRPTSDLLHILNTLNSLKLRTGKTSNTNGLFGCQFKLLIKLMQRNLII
jgi:hypothetical protein